MSGEAIRTAARAMVAEPGWPAGAPYFETENADIVDAAALPDVWMTLQFLAFTDERIAVGPLPTCFQERGTVSLPIFARAGMGDSDGVSAAESVRAFAHAWGGWPAGFNISQISPPSSPEPGADGGWYRIDIDLEYSWHHVTG
jgi:hypothetical protein